MQKSFLHIILFIGILLTVPFSFSQDGGSDQQLAQYYYNNGEFDKALIYYEKLYDENPSKFIFERYIECLTQTGDLKQAEKTIKKQISRNKGDQEYKIALAKFYENYDSQEKANEIYEELIEDLSPNARDIITLYNAFRAQAKNDLALETLTRGRKLLKKSYPLNIQFADYYGSVGETEKMISEYIDLIDYHPSYMNSVQTILARQIDFSEEDSEEYDLLREILIDRSQKHPNESAYSEMLTWLFIQRQNFTAAFVHIKALDKRNNAEGKLVYNLGGICVENQDYSTAKKCFQYVVDLGKTSIYSTRAQRALLNVSFLQVTQLREYTNEELQATINEYERVLSITGMNQLSLPLIMELAHIKAFYANDALGGIKLLEDALVLPGLTDIEEAEVKMQLADVNVLHGDIWEAALLYSQVDKDFKYEPIGHEAKFKNARIFYYDGEFDFAQSQLDVLKQSTSKLIANDALKLSLLITDNFGLDSNYTAMTWFANADLLIEQHQYDSAFMLFDSIIIRFPAHSLGDEILLKKARAQELQGKWNEAISTLQELLKYHGEDILADDALFQLGNIYQNRLFDNEKASQYYKEILFKHKGSLYTTEARKRFRALRGAPSTEKEPVN